MMKTSTSMHTIATTTKTKGDNMTRKIPMRKCVVTQEKHPKNELIRVVLTPENEIEVDKTGRLNGRGAYLLLNEETVLKAKKTGALNRSLKTQIPDTVYEALLELVHEK